MEIKEQAQQASILKESSAQRKSEAPGGVKKSSSKVQLNDNVSEKMNSSNSEEKEGSASDDSASVKEVNNNADDAWRFYTEAQCEKILDNDPFNMQARFRSAQIWINNQENMEDAEKLLISIQKQDPTFLKSEIHILYGDKLSSPLYKEYDQAIEQYEAAATLEPKNVDCHIKLANLYELKREFDQAVKIYKKILKHDASCFKALMKLGLVQIRNNVRDRGI